VRIEREKLRYMALMALDEAAEACRAKPVERSVSLRFLLAWLYFESGSEPANKWLFDGFWKAVTAVDEVQQPMVSYCRSTSAQACLNGISRLLGYERTASFLQEMKEARRRLRGR
jgi:hypothetical protein